MSPKRLPQELIDHTLHFLERDNSSLSSCSLVSRSWTHPAHRHLFHHLQLHMTKGCLTQRYLFLELLEHRPTLCKYVQILTLREGRYSDDVVFDGAVLTNILVTLPRLEELHLEHMLVWPFLGDESEIATNKRALKVLSLKCVEFAGEYPSLLQLLQPISSVDSLHVDNLPSVYDHSSPRVTLDALSGLELPTRFRVKTLTLRDHRAASLLFIRAFTKLPPGTIQSLHLETASNLYDTRIVPHVQRMLKVIGPGVKDLTVELGLWTVDDHPDLSTFTSLRSLRFRVQNGTIGLATLRMTTTLETLSTLPSLAFTLVYEIFASPNARERSNTDLVKFFDWGLIETRLLALPRLPTSVYVIVFLGPKRALGMTINQIEDTIRPRLPELDARGLLSIQLGDDP